MRTLNSYATELVVSSGCLLFKGPKDKDGYGTLEAGKAHRLAWSQQNGPIPVGMHVLHKCDTPACINPEHLFLGTHQDNMLDMKNKGRVIAHKGRQHGNAVLTEEQVRQIRYGTESLRALALQWGVSYSTVRNVYKDRTRWKHVTA